MELSETDIEWYEQALLQEMRGRIGRPQGTIIEGSTYVIDRVEMEGAFPDTRLEATFRIVFETRTLGLPHDVPIGWRLRVWDDDDSPDVQGMRIRGDRVDTEDVLFVLGEDIEQLGPESLEPDADEDGVRWFDERFIL